MHAIALQQIYTNLPSLHVCWLQLLALVDLLWLCFVTMLDRTGSWCLRALVRNLYRAHVPRVLPLHLDMKACVIITCKVLLHCARLCFGALSSYTSSKISPSVVFFGQQYASCNFCVQVSLTALSGMACCRVLRWTGKPDPGFEGVEFPHHSLGS